MERNLRMEGRRLVATHSLFESLVADLYLGGVRCDCCPGFWRFDRSNVLQAALDVRQRRFDWLWKRHPGMMRRLSADEIRQYARTGREDGRWWERVLQQHGGKPGLAE